MKTGSKALNAVADGPSISRRGLLLSAGAAGLVGSGPRGVFAAGAESSIKVGFISPRTGALGGFGQTDGYVLDSCGRRSPRG